MIKKYMKYGFALLFVLIGLLNAASAFSRQAVPIVNTKPTWIWYPGDMEVWLHKIVTSRREEKNKTILPGWKISAPYQEVEFSKTVKLKTAETIQVKAQGDFVLLINGKQSQENGPFFTIPAGEQQVIIRVKNTKTVPALFVKGNKIISDNSWIATFNSKVT